MTFFAQKIFIIGGAGFIGSHITDWLLEDTTVKNVTVYDNFSSGTEWHLSHNKHDNRLTIIKGDVQDLTFLKQAMDGHSLVIHLASNPDIARAITEPTIDFDQGTYLTHHVVEAMRHCKVNTLLYASGSGVYGETGHQEVSEDYGPLHPISTYAASKLAGEALICSYCHMFGISARVFRFGNVVGARQTHGVGFDFIRLLTKNPSHLKILGDGTQSKSYIYVEDIISAMFTALTCTDTCYQVYNVACLDYITVNEIAHIAMNVAGLEPSSVEVEYTGGNRGWKGDVPIIRMNTEKIRQLGWKNNYSSLQAMELSIRNLWQRIHSNKSDPIYLNHTPNT